MIKYSNKQTGGVILGIIIGLVVGLGIAVVVAVTITKTSLPFMNKSGKTEKQELTAGQAADPNRPMYGKQAAAKAAAKEFAKETEPNPTVEETKLPAEAAKPDDKPAEVKAAAIKPEAAADDKWIYFLQAGAFREQSDAEGIKAKLALQGFEASISEKPSDNGPLYRVRLGPFSQLDAMNRVRGKLSDSGMDVAVVRITK